jgi:hypothetical protein
LTQEILLMGSADVKFETTTLLTRELQGVKHDAAMMQTFLSPTNEQYFFKLYSLLMSLD